MALGVFINRELAAHLLMQLPHAAAATPAPCALGQTLHEAASQGPPMLPTGSDSAAGVGTRWPVRMLVPFTVGRDDMDAHVRDGSSSTSALGQLGGDAQDVAPPVDLTSSLTSVMQLLR
jgi:hypothetical protein